MNCPFGRHLLPMWIDVMACLKELLVLIPYLGVSCTYIIQFQHVPKLQTYLYNCLKIEKKHENLNLFHTTTLCVQF